MRRALAAAALVCAAAVPAPPAPAAADLDALRLAASPQQAGALEERILAAWRAQLTPSVQILAARATGAMQAGRPRDATADFDAALDLQPELGDLWRQRAEARYAAGDEKGALADLAQALSREPRCFPALADLSNFAEGRDNARAALAAWEKLLEIDPKAGQGEARLKRLQHKVTGQPT